MSVACVVIRLIVLGFGVYVHQTLSCPCRGGKTNLRGKTEHWRRPSCGRPSRSFCPRFRKLKIYFKQSDIKKELAISL